MLHCALVLLFQLHIIRGGALDKRFSRVAELTSNVPSYPSAGEAHKHDNQLGVFPRGTGDNEVVAALVNSLNRLVQSLCEFGVFYYGNSPM